MELGAYIASKPNHGRQDLLRECAVIAERNMLAEDDMDRALRLAMPPLADLLFNRLPRTEPQATELHVPRSGGTAQPKLSDQPSMAAV